MFDWKTWYYLLWEIVLEFRHSLQREVEKFTFALENRINELVSQPLHPEWRKQMAHFLLHWEGEGYRLTPRSLVILEWWIVAVSKKRGFWPPREPPPVASYRVGPTDNDLPDVALTAEVGPKCEVGPAKESGTRASEKRQSRSMNTSSDRVGSAPLLAHPGLVADGKTSDYAKGEAEAFVDIAAQSTDRTVAERFSETRETTHASFTAGQELQWLELPINVVLFPFGNYKTDDFAQDVATANRIFERCRIRVKLRSVKILTEEQTRKAGTIYQPNQQEPPRAILDPRKLASMAPAEESDVATVYYVPAIKQLPAGQQVSATSAVVASHGASGNRRQARVLAHELAHVMRLRHVHGDVRNLMIDIDERDLEVLGLKAQWEQFKKRYKGPTATASDLARRFDAFVYHTIAHSTNLHSKQCDDMRMSPLLRAIE
jgi:hypothetical protein